MAPPTGLSTASSTSSQEYAGYFSGARKQLHLPTDPKSSLVSNGALSSNISQGKYLSQHSTHSGSMTSHHAVSLPTSPPKYTDGCHSTQQQYNVRLYQDCSRSEPDPVTADVSDIFSRKLDDDFQQALRRKTCSPVSLFSDSSTPCPLDFTVGSKDCLDTDNCIKKLAQDAELDISLEHETCSVGSKGSMDTPISAPPRDKISKSDLTHNSCQARQPAKAPTKDADRLRTRSVENLSPCKQSYKQWNMVDIDIDNSSVGGVTGQLGSRNTGRHTGEQSTNNRELPPPINSSRLRPIRQKTRNAVVNILEDGWVCLEFFKSKNAEDKVLEVLKVSPDGLKIQVYQPNKCSGSRMKERPPTPPLSGDKTTREYSYQQLPHKYYKKYQYAARFVNLVKSRTPKVILYTHRAKCMLMENQPKPDFDVVFYDGAKFSQTSGGTRITESGGTALTLEPEGSMQHLSASTRDMCTYAQECHGLCEKLESLLESAQKDSSSQDVSYFPIRVGRRPTQISTAVDNDKTPVAPNQPQVVRSGGQGHVVAASRGQSQANNVTSPITVHRSHRMPRTEAAAQTSSRPTSTKSTCSQAAVAVRNQQTPVARGVPASQQPTSQPQPQPQSPSVLFKVFVPGIGWGSQLSSGEVAVQFMDGSEVAIQPSPMVVRFTDQRGRQTRFRESDQLPPQVRQKLESLPVVMSKMEMAQSAAASRLKHT